MLGVRLTAPRYGSWLDTSRSDYRGEVIPLDTRGPKRLWTAPAGYVSRHRGATVVKNTYVCPVHGAFEASGDAESARCVRMVQQPWWPDGQRSECGVSSPWSPSPFSVWASSGEVKS